MEIAIGKTYEYSLREECGKLNIYKPDNDLDKFKEEVESDFYLKPIKKDNLRDEVEKALKNIIKWISESKLNFSEFYRRKDEMKKLFEAVDKNSTIFVKISTGLEKQCLLKRSCLSRK
ncbi:MAG: hypothetical protein QMD06_01235 [Candidatus Altarchaeum sp.]|nr:hypothetical protein [Candidatus Altarchaeum sp.]